MQLVDIEDRFVMIKRAHTMDDDNHDASSLHHDDNHGKITLAENYV